MEIDLTPIVQRWDKLGSALGTELFVVRDDLLPFPLAGNKVRKLAAEFRIMPHSTTLVISNGGIDSNHCRTAAWFAALHGVRSHLVLHGACAEGGRALEMLRALGATYQVVRPTGIAETLSAAASHERDRGGVPVVIPGGCHSRAGAIAYRDAGLSVLREIHPNSVYVASGTGATQGGLIAAAARSASPPKIVGISVARDRGHGSIAVEEAARWAGADQASICFDDGFRAGGYARQDERTVDAVRFGWEHGLPLDGTYTGKAFAAILEAGRAGRLPPRTVFWHTGGLWNWIGGST